MCLTKGSSDQEEDLAEDPAMETDEQSGEEVPETGGESAEMQEPGTTSEAGSEPTPEPTPEVAPDPDPVLAEEPFFESVTVDGVIITVNAPAGVFPAGAVLSVESVPTEKVEAAIEQERENGRNVAVSYTFDIKILDAERNELQPADGQSVKISFQTAEATDENLDTQIWHISEDETDGTLEAEALETTTAGQTVNCVKGTKQKCS